MSRFSRIAPEPGERTLDVRLSVRRLAQLLADERQHVVRVGIAADHLLLEDELAVDMHVEDPVLSGHDLNRSDLALFPLLEQRRRQTDGVRARPSGDAVLDPDVVSLGHRVIVSDN
jgi:hypothetical protein